MLKKKKSENFDLLQKTGTAWDQLGAGIHSILQIFRETMYWGRLFLRTIPNDQTRPREQDVSKDIWQKSEQDFHPPAPWVYW